jgi:hypothetical protein
MSDADGYEAWNPRRLCDTCGDLYRLSQMRRLPGNVWSCNVLCAGERSATELSKANASQKPFLYRPVRNAKPEDPFNPDTFEADDGPILNFVARMVTAGTRYESVVAGDPAPLAGHKIDGLAWAGAYLYNVIADAKLGASTIARAKTLLSSVATQLMARQRGFGLFSTATQATDLFYGGFIESGATTYITQNTATSGLAMLYAYRVFGTTAYVTSARAAASYLRNVQAIGSNGSQFTSSDAPGTARLYTGAVCSEVSTASGVDPGQNFYSNHLFYPGDLIALQLWNELKITDGDQTIGCTATINGFDSTPSQLLSTSIADMRAFWANGVRDSALETYTGLSSTTPREFFNAYPATKSGFNVTGTGRWEYQDGNAATGTLISSLNFAKGLSALFAYEGASAQVTTVDGWMRSFTSNADFETPAIVSDYTPRRFALPRCYRFAIRARLLPLRSMPPASTTGGPSEFCLPSGPRRTRGHFRRLVGLPVESTFATSTARIRTMTSRTVSLCEGSLA